MHYFPKNRLWHLNITTRHQYFKWQISIDPITCIFRDNTMEHVCLLQIFTLNHLGYGNRKVKVFSKRALQLNANWFFTPEINKSVIRKLKNCHTNWFMTHTHTLTREHQNSSIIGWFLQTFNRFEIKLKWWAASISKTIRK